MSGIGPKLPLNQITEGGFSLTKTIAENVQQNLKNLVLTSPGERIMNPDFGVGLRNYLFENANEGLYSTISSRLHSQVQSYMPFLDIEDVYIGPHDDAGANQNTLNVVITYKIEPIDMVDILTITNIDTI